jgi:hypothetical protein
MINPEFGYYMCDGIKFEKKIEAVIYSKIKNKPIDWYFQDHIFTKHNWQIEPEESLNELYDKRAKELRKKYDYLILCFSGGSDSFNILESFIRQNIHLDEIVTVYTEYVVNTHAELNVKNKSNSNLSAEHILNTIPRLKYASEKLPKTKITVLDDTNSVMKSIKQFENEDWIFKRNDHLGPIGPSRFNFFEIKDLRLKFDKYNSVGIIYGRDKPKIKFRGNQVYTTFSDVALNTIKATTHNPDYTNITSEYFYWNSSCLPMLTKQAHVVKRWLENNPLKLKYWINASDPNNRAMQEHLLKDVIYTSWNNNWFQVEKNLIQWNNGEDWFSKDPQFAKEYMLWKRGLDYASNLMKEHIVYNNNIPYSFNIFMKWYFVGTLINTTPKFK